MRHISISGKKYRVEANFNAIMDFMEQKGEKDIAFLAGELSMKDWTMLMVACVNEGERLDGKPHDLTMENVGTLSFVEVSSAVQEFIKVFSEQNAGEASEAKKK